MSVEVRRARDDELEAAGRAVAEAYRGNPGMDDDLDYLDFVRDARGRARDSEVLVAVDAGGAIVGTVSYVPDFDSPMADLAHEGEAEFRMLGVLPAARGSGAGTALVNACIARARESGRSALVLSTPPDWTTGQRLYEALGFRRAPDRDFDPVPGFRLWAYVIDL